MTAQDGGLPGEHPHRRATRTKSPSGVESTLTAILGRTAAYEGEERTWDKVAGGNDALEGEDRPRARWPPGRG